MTTLSRLFAVLLGMLLVSGPELASAQGMIGTSMGSGGGLSMGAANGTFLRLDGTNTMAAALTSSNGTFKTSGATTSLVLESNLVATGGVDVGIILRNTAALDAADTAFIVYDSTSTQLAKLDGAGNFTSVGIIVTDRVYAPYYADTAGVERFRPTLVGPNTYTSNDAADGAMIAHKFVTANTAATTDKLFSIQNVTTEKLYVDAIGSLIPAVTVSTDLGTSLLRYRNGFIATMYGTNIVAASWYDTGAVTQRFAFTVAGKSANTATTTLTAGVDLGHTFFVTTDFLADDKVLQWGDNTSTELGAVYGNGSMQIDGNLAVGTTLTSSTNYRIETGGTLTPAAGDANAIHLAGTLDSVDGNAYGIDMDALIYTAKDTKNVTEINIAGTVATVNGETYPRYASLDIAAPAKTGTGTITAAYGIRVAEPTAGATNYAIEATGTVSIVGDLLLPLSSVSASDALGIDMSGSVLEGAIGARGFYMGNTGLDPGDNQQTYGVFLSPYTIADAGETVTASTNLYVGAMTKTGTGTVTATYGAYIVESTIGGTNVGLYVQGTTNTTGLQINSGDEITSSRVKSGTLDFGSIAANTCAELTQVLTGCAINYPIACSAPASLESNLISSCFCSTTDQVTQRVCNPTVGAIDPANGQTFGARTIL